MTVGKSEMTVGKSETTVGKSKTMVGKSKTMVGKSEVEGLMETVMRVRMRLFLLSVQAAEGRRGDRSNI